VSEQEKCFENRGYRVGKRHLHRFDHYYFERFSSPAIPATPTGTRIHPARFSTVAKVVTFMPNTGIIWEDGFQSAPDGISIGRKVFKLTQNASHQGRAAGELIIGCSSGVTAPLRWKMTVPNIRIKAKATTRR
jgi:hypothetical protein